MRSKIRDGVPDLAPILWHSFGSMAALLQEVVSVYPALSPPTLSGPASNRVCNALALLQCVASHPDTRALFLNGAGRAAGGAWLGAGARPVTLTAANPRFPRRSAHAAVYVPLSQHEQQDAAV